MDEKNYPPPDKPTTEKRKQQASSTGRVQNVPVVQDNWRTKLMKARIKFDDEQKILYLNAIASHGMKGRAAQTAGVCMQTVNDHLQNDPDFAEARGEALETYRDMFVDHAMSLALEGEKHKFYDKDGNLISEKHVYPIRLIELELKRIEPGFRDKQTIELNASGGGVLVAPAEQSPEDWIKSQRAANDGKAAPADVDDKKAKEK